MTSDLYDRALNLCLVYHKGQFRNDGVTPYHTHPIAVAESLDEEYDKIAGLLHDILEDTACTTYVLRKHRIPDQVIEAVIRLTKVKGESHEDYITNILEDMIAIRTKLADMNHNMSSNPSVKASARYAKDIPILMKALGK